MRWRRQTSSFVKGHPLVNIWRFVEFILIDPQNARHFVVGCGCGCCCCWWRWCWCWCWWWVCVFCVLVFVFFLSCEVFLSKHCSFYVICVVFAHASWIHTLLIAYKHTNIHTYIPLDHTYTAGPVRLQVHIALGIRLKGLPYSLLGGFGVVKVTSRVAKPL